MPITPELLDHLMKDYRSPDDLLSQDGLLQQLTKALLERALEGELTHHLGYEKHSPEGKNSVNSRNSKSSKTVRGRRNKASDLHDECNRITEYEFEKSEQDESIVPK